MNVIDSFDAGWRQNPEMAVLVDATTGNESTYQEVGEFTHRFAYAVDSAGLNGCRIAVISPNGVLMYSVVLGLMRSEAVWLPINYRSGESELTQMLQSMDCQVLFYDPNLYETIAAVASQISSLREVVPLTQEAVDAWIGEQPCSGFSGSEDPETVYAIQPTGGTTGHPKGVLMPQRYIDSLVRTFASVAPFDATNSPRPVYLAVAPLTHASGQVLQYAMSQGGVGVVLSTAKAGDILAAIEKFQVTHIFLPPTVIYGLLEHPLLQQHDYSSLQYVMYGAAPMAPEKLAAAVSAFGPVLAQIYGQTETGVPNLYLSPADHFIGGDPANGVADPQRLAAAGRVPAGMDVVLIDEEGNTVADGETGEIAVRGASLALGYHGNGSETVELFGSGYLRTGDIARRDHEGYYYIVDRKKDIIISGGFNVFSAEVERVLLAHPDVQEAAVFGIPDEKWGEAVTAVVEPKFGHTVDPKALQQFCRSELGPVKTPKQIVVAEELPRTPTGKILKRDLKAPYWDASERSVS